MTEQTLSIIKPDAVERNLEDKIMDFFKLNGLKILKNKKVKITLNNNTIEAIGFNATLEENQIKFRTNNALNSIE